MKFAFWNGIGLLLKDAIDFEFRIGFCDGGHWDGSN